MRQSFFLLASLMLLFLLFDEWELLGPLLVLVRNELIHGFMLYLFYSLERLLV